MREIEKKTSDKIREFIERVGRGMKNAEANASGSIGRAANKMASGVESMAQRLKSKPTEANHPSYTQEDMDKALQIWKEQGMGKIGNKPKGDKYMEKPNPEKYMEKPSGDHYMNKPHSMGGKMGKYEFFGQFNDGKVPQNYVMKRGYSEGEKNLGRTIIGTGYAGGVTGEAINYAMDENEAERKKRSESSNFMSKEITSQKDAHNSWTKRKYGNQ